MSLFTAFRDGQLARLQASRSSSGLFSGSTSSSSRPLPPRSPWWRQASPSGSTTPMTGGAPAAGDAGRFGWDAKATFDKYTSQIDYTAPDALDQLYTRMRADGIMVERDKNDLFRIPGTEAGWVDILQNKAHVEGRGPVRGWAYQPFYGREDFARLTALGSNPHTGEMALPGQRFTRDSDAPIGGTAPGASSLLGGDDMGVPGQRRFKTAPANANAGRQSTISAGYRAAAPSTRRAAIGSPSMMSSRSLSAPLSASTTRRRRASGGYSISGTITTGAFDIPHTLGRSR